MMPVTELVKWLKKQDEDVQREIAFLMSSSLPGFDNNDCDCDRFHSRIEEISGANPQDVGFVVAFRAIFNFVIVNKRSTDQGWDMTRRLFKSVLEDTDPNQPLGMKASTQRMLDELPARIEKWISICGDWQKLEKSALSDNAIEAWEIENLPFRRSRFEASDDNCEHP